MEKRTNIDTLDTLNNIQDGLLALRFIANTDNAHIADQYEFFNAYNYVSEKVYDDLQTVRADLTVKVVVEDHKTGTD